MLIEDVFLELSRASTGSRAEVLPPRTDLADLMIDLDNVGLSQKNDKGNYDLRSFS